MDATQVSDPLRPMNKTFFVFNDKLFLWVVKPVAIGYSYIIPRPGRVGVRNLVDNLGFPRRFINTALQGHPGRSGIELARFGVNTTLGVAGLFDPATKLFHWKRYDEDFDQTLGVWGCGPGIYLNWPTLGPSSLRATLALPLDIALHYLYYNSVYWVNEASLGGIEDYEAMKRASLDPYIAMRDGYYDHRRQMVAE